MTGQRCTLYYGCLALIVAGTLHQCATSYGVVNVSVYLSICTEKEQRDASRFYGQKVLKMLKFTQFYELSMETTHCHSEVCMIGQMCSKIV